MTFTESNFISITENKNSLLKNARGVHRIILNENSISFLSYNKHFLLKTSGTHSFREPFYFNGSMLSRCSHKDHGNTLLHKSN